MEKKANTSKATWLLLALFILMAISITETKEVESVAPEATYTVIYFWIPSNVTAIIIKTTDAYAGQEIIIIAELRSESNYTADTFTMNLTLPANFSLSDGNLTQLNPQLFEDEDFVAIWSVKVPSTKGNYTILTVAPGTRGTRVVEVTNMPEKTETWLTKNAEALFSVGIIIAVVIIAFIFAYLAINLGKKKEEKW